MASNKKTIEELTEQVEGLIRQTQEIGDAVATALDAALQKGGKRLVKVEQSESGVELYAEPTPYFAQPVENASTAELLRELAQAEADLEAADTWVERERAKQRVESLRRDLRFAAMDPPTVNAKVAAVMKTPTNAREFMAPNTAAQTDPELIRQQVERFERRTRS